MKRFDWKVGDRITLKRQIFPFDPELTIRGTYVHPVQTTSLFFPMEYFQQSIGNPGQVGTFWVKVRDPKQMAAISQQIDAMFKNSDFPTETFTEKEFQQNFMSMMGNVKLLFTAVSIVRDLHGGAAGGDHDVDVGARARHRDRGAESDRLRAAPRPRPSCSRSSSCSP